MFCLIFVGHYGSVVRQQINSLGLNISIAWLGSELEHVISRVEGQPYLLLNWEPNAVSRTKKMTRISFPPCRYVLLLSQWLSIKDCKKLKGNQTKYWRYPVMD